MSDETAGARSMSLAPMIAGGVLSVGLLGGLGWAAINIPGALSTPPASAPAAPANGGYQEPAPAPTPEPYPSDEGDASPEEDEDIPDVEEEETEQDESPDSDSDSDPDRDSDQNGDTWLDDEMGAEIQEADIIYRVEVGDTLAGISDEFSISVDMLADYNDIRDVDTIYKESKLLIPYSEVNVSTEDLP